MLFLPFLAILSLLLMNVPFGNAVTGGEEDEKSYANHDKSLDLLADFEDNVLGHLTNQCPSVENGEEVDHNSFTGIDWILCSATYSFADEYENLQKHIYKVNTEEGNQLTTNNEETNKTAAHPRDPKTDHHPVHDRWTKLKPVLHSFFVKIRHHIYTHMTELDVSRYSATVLGNERMKRLDSHLRTEILQMGPPELKKFFMSTFVELKKANELKHENGLDKLKELQKEAEIVYKITQIAKAIDKGINAGDLEAVEFLIQLFCANVLFCAKGKAQWLQHPVVEWWSNSKAKTP